MRVIILGGTGLIGQALATSLHTDGHEVIVLSRSPYQDTELPKDVKIEHWDTKSAYGWGEHANGAGAIVNLAGASIAGDGFLPAKWTDERKKIILESRVNAGKAVVEAVEQARVKPGVVIQSSAVGYYGAHGTEEITEEHPPGDDFLADVCKEWEASTEAVEAMGVRRCVIRTGVVLSMKGGALPRQVLPFRMFAGGPIGNGKQIMPWIHIDDQVKAMRFLIDNDEAHGAFNLVAPNPPNNTEFSRSIAHALNRPSYIPVPGFAFQLAFGEVSKLLTEGQKAVPNRLLELGYEFAFTDAEAAIRDLEKQRK